MGRFSGFADIAEPKRIEKASPYQGSGSPRLNWAFRLSSAANPSDLRVEASGLAVLVEPKKFLPPPCPLRVTGDTALACHPLGHSMLWGGVGHNKHPAFFFSECQAPQPRHNSTSMPNWLLKFMTECIMLQSRKIQAAALWAQWWGTQYLFKSCANQRQTETLFHWAKLLSKTFYSLLSSALVGCSPLPPQGTGFSQGKIYPPGKVYHQGKFYPSQRDSVVHPRGNILPSPFSIKALFGSRVLGSRVQWTVKFSMWQFPSKISSLLGNKF